MMQDDQNMHGGAEGVAPAATVIPRVAPELDPARAAKVSEWQKTIREDRAHWMPEFKRVRRDMEFAKLGADAEWVQGKNYTANIIQRQVNNRVAELYAKNPKAVAKRAKRLYYKIWDGDPAALMVAQQMFTASIADPASVVDPNALANMQALMQDVQQGMQQQKMLDKIAETLQILFEYFQSEQSPVFKKQAKRAVRRALVAGVAYVELGFQRILEKQPEIAAQLEDATHKLATMESLAADMADGVLDRDDAAMETLRVLIATLQNQETLIVREGPTFDWGVGATEIIPDKNCRQLNGFIGAGHVAREYSMSAKEIQTTWGVDVSTGTGGTVSLDNGEVNTAITEPGGGSDTRRDAKRLVWKVWDKRTGTEFVITDGWPDYIKEPAAPNAQLERFWPVFVLEFNPVEDGDTPSDKADGVSRRRIHGLSDVELIRDMQSEYNRSRQGLREHRIANRPAHFVTKGALEETDKAQIQAHAANDVIEMNQLPPGGKIEDVLQRKPVNPIDPALYDTSQVFEDIQRAAGSQDANFGNLSGATATEASIAEGGRVGGSKSNIDDLDDLLTELARATGQLLFLNMSADQVVKIVGPGAFWPEFSAQEIAEEIYLTVKAGSSGRPNRELEIANMERMTPMLLQIPGISPRWLAEQMLKRLDDDLSLEEAFTEGLPSIMAMNALQGSPAAPAQGAGEGPQSDPNQQGGRGGQNQPQGPAQSGGPQPAFPTGRPGV